MIFGEWRRWKNNLSRKARDRKSVRSARPRFEVLEGREVPAGFVPGSIQGQDGWSGGIIPISASVDQFVDLSGSNAHAGWGAWHISNNTSNGNHNGAFAGWVFSPGLSVTAGQPSSGALGDLFTATFYFKAGSSVADGSNLEVDLGSSAGDDRNSFLAITNDTDSDGGLKLRISEPDGVTGSFKPTLILVTDMSRTDWHRIDIVARFHDGTGNDTFEVFLNGNALTNPTTGGTTFGTFEGWRDGGGNANPAGPDPYVLSNRLLFRSGAAASAYDPTFADTAAKGFFIDDVSYSVATQANPNVKLASYAATFDSAVYVDDSWAGTAIGADPDGDGAATAFGYDAFATIQEGIDKVLSGGTVHVAAGTYNELVTVNKEVTILGAQTGVDARFRTGVDESIVSNASGAFQIGADNVTIDGFTIRDVDASGLTAGVHAVGVSNFNILNNIITNNAIGIFARPTGASLIQQNLFDGNNTIAAGGASAIYSEGSVDLTVDNNTFVNHTAPLGSIVRFVGPDDVRTVNHTGLTFTNNLLDDNGSGVFAMTVSGGLFQGNTISTAGAGTALTFGEAVTNVDVLNNDLSGNLRGLRVQEFGFVQGDNPSSNIEAHSNDLSGNTEYGLGIVGTGFTGKLDASGNWWGASTAAGVAAQTSGNVDFMPFLVTGVDTDPIAAGFQGDATVAPGQGSVRVMVVGGRLTIIGDRRDNLITVEKGPEANSYIVTGLAGTQINGLSGSFDFKNVTRGIGAWLGGGNDMLVLDGSASPFTVSGTVRVRAGNGDDLVRFEDVTVDGQTVVRGGNGADSVQAVNSVLDAALIRTGFGNDTVRLEGVHAKGRVQVETGRHTDMVAVSDSIFDAAVVLDGGYGNDDIDDVTPGNTFEVAPVIRGF